MLHNADDEHDTHTGRADGTGKVDVAHWNARYRRFVDHVVLAELDTAHKQYVAAVEHAALDDELDDPLQRPRKGLSNEVDVDVAVFFERDNRAQEDNVDKHEAIDITEMRATITTSRHFMIALPMRSMTTPLRNKTAPIHCLTINLKRGPKLAVLSAAHEQGLNASQIAGVKLQTAGSGR